MNILSELANKYRTDKGTEGPHYHGYTDAYYEKMKDMKDSVKKVLEIGLGNGAYNPDGDCKACASVKMFRDFFVNSIIYGVDIEQEIVEKYNNMENIKLYTCDSRSKEQLNSLMNEIGDDFDIIMDDGSHSPIDQLKLIGDLFKYVKSGGIYVIEDIHTSIWGGFGLPPNHPDSCLSVLNNYNSTGKFSSVYISAENLKYLNENIKNVEVVDIKGVNNDITSFIYKK